MQSEIVWYILAGFLIGFVVSTLWEWVYFRRERMKVRDARIRDLEAQLAEMTRTDVDRDVELEDVPPPWVAHEVLAQDYQSPGVFLETEESRSEFEGSTETSTARSTTMFRRKEATVVETTKQASPDKSWQDVDQVRTRSVQAEPAQSLSSSTAEAAAVSRVAVASAHGATTDHSEEADTTDAGSGGGDAKERAAPENP